MFNIGLAEILVILAVALIVIGPKDLPKIAAKMGDFLGQLKSLKEDLTLEGISRSTNAKVLKEDETRDDS